MPPTHTTPTEMTLEQLHAQLGELLATRGGAGQWTVRIPYSRGRPGLGARSATAVESLSVGFDHDQRRIFLEPATPLGLGDEELRALGRRAERQAGLIFLLNREAEKAKVAGTDTGLAERILTMIATREGGMKPRVAATATPVPAASPPAPPAPFNPFSYGDVDVMVERVLSLLPRLDSFDPEQHVQLRPELDEQERVRQAEISELKVLVAKCLASGRACLKTRCCSGSP